MKQGLKWITLAFAVTMLLPCYVRGQAGSTGAITGVVEDEKGGGIPNARVVVTNLATGTVEREVTTTGVGTFNVPLLRPGTYKVGITAPGFATFIAEKVIVQVTETTSVNAVLKIGQITETVVVSEVAAPVQLTTAATGQVIGAHTVGTLPLSTGNFLTLLTLSAGANTELFDSAALGRGQVTINVNGQRPVNNNYQLEGINANDINLPILDNVPLPNPSVVQEFKTQTSLYDASMGRNGGGNVQVNLKSGTNAYHGNAYEFFRNDFLNANDWFFNRDGTPRPVLKQNLFGASFGGPIPKIKDLFFFLNYQGIRARSGISTGTSLSTSSVAMPTDRSEANLTSLFFPGGLPPGFTNLDPVALAFVNLPASNCPLFNDGTFCLPSGGTPGLTGPNINTFTLTQASVGKFTNDQYTVTADKQITSKDKFTGRWFFSNHATVQPFGGGSSLPFQRDVPGSNRFLKLGWTRVFSSNIVNDFRFGFSRFTFAFAPSEPIALTDIGATRPNSADFPAAFRIAISGVAGAPASVLSLGTGVNDDRGGNFNTFYWADDVSVTAGKHLFRLGMDVSRYQLNRFNRFATRGSVAFANTSAGAGGPLIPALRGFQNFLLGRVTSTQGGAGFFTFYFRATDYSAYIQDDWKIHPRLTLNLGLRWEGLSIADEKQNFLSNFAGLGDGQPGPIRIIHPEHTPRVGTPGVSGCTALDCLDINNIAPRVGFAWDVFGDQKTVLRSGYGLYYQRTSNQPLLQTSGGLPFSQAVSATAFSVGLNNPFPTLRPQSDFPLAQDQVVPALVGFNGTTGAPIFASANGGPLSGFFFFPVRDFRAPNAHQWNLSIQRQLYKNWALEVGYVGTRGVALIGPGRPFNAGQICTTGRPCVIPPNIGLNVNVPGGTPFVTKNPDGSILITGNTAANINARVPVQFLGLANSRGFFQEQAGASTYHGLQTTLSHQFSSGLYFQGAYTYSKSIDNGSGSAFGDELNGLVHYGDYFDVNGNRGVSDFDRTHRVVVSYNYELPFAKWAGIGDRGFGRIVNGWAVNGVTTFQSGNPITVFDSGAVTLQDTDFVNTTNKPLLAPGATIATGELSGSPQSRIDDWLNLSAFVSGGACVDNQNVVVAFTDPSCTGFTAVGNVSRNAYRGPFQQHWDMSVTKVTKITERHSVEFRAEFFNVWNHPVFNSPGVFGLGSSTGNLGLVDIAGGTGASAIFSTANRPRIIQFALKYNF